jgi:hypothetical protein
MELTAFQAILSATMCDDYCITADQGGVGEQIKAYSPFLCTGGPVQGNSSGEGGGEGEQIKV